MLEGRVFSKILIANRGEIACRIIKTARRLGCRVVAVYSDADENAMHVELADEAVRVGPPRATDSYLAIEKIVAACRQTGAEAVHPGYGFLSENPEFLRQLEEAGIVFIGPSRDAMGRLGDKIAAKRLAQTAGVNTVPGFVGELADAEHAVDVARQLGYPILLKASAGGGGRGMRIARDDADCRSAFESAVREARASFGDGRLLIERYVATPRHIEIQILGDRHGNIVSLGERECSLQRRHQKVIEEAPSPLVDDDMRRAMSSQAVALAQAAGYYSAGTVEFIVDADRNFFFLEMNTRLQVEHPVTEYVTGLDLVEQMIRIAAGEPLWLTQADVALSGWAMEARVYAEDPFRGFLPSAGRLVHYVPPAESAALRVDTGVDEGSEISLHYDPMIAKVIAQGSTREECRLRLREALNEFYLRGVNHNISFLTALVDHPRFQNGQLSTHLIAEEYPDGFHPSDTVHDDPALLATVAAVIHRRYRERAAQICGQLPGYERTVENDWVVMLGDARFKVVVRPISDGHEVMVENQTHRVTSDWQFGQPLFRGAIGGEPVCVQIERQNLTYRLTHWGCQIDATVLSARAADLLSQMPAKARPDHSRFVLSPMPGLLVHLAVQTGDHVKAGQDLAIVEAMKMENLIRSERDGAVRHVFAGVGETLAVDQPILELATIGETLAG
jgi:propionyl-CoA carboxylase alpha chain